MSIQNVAANVRRVIGLSSTSRRTSRPDQMQFVLPDLRAADPAFTSELSDGRLPLATGAIVIGNAGLFETPANDALKRELYGFAWLRHLHAARTPDAEDHARRHLLAWSRSTARRSALALEPAVISRRALSLFAHVDIALTGASAKDFDAVMDLVSDEFATLAEAAPRMPMAQPRLTALIALAAFHVCSGTQETAARQAIERRLGVELNRQILADGGHISRSLAAVLDLTLDLLPLQRVYVAAQLPVPQALGAALIRLRAMLDLMSHADRQIGRFNGMGATAITELSLAMKTLPPAADDATASRMAAETGYIRLQCEDALVLFDAGPGDDTLAGETPFAGALSFEFSAGRSPLIVNCGSDHVGGGLPRLETRATSSHSTLTLGGALSAPATGARGGSTKAALLKVEDDIAPSTIRASTDGYKQRFGYVHQRTLALLREGWLLEGTDRLEPLASASADVPFDIRFHLHPTVYVEADAQAETLRLTAADGSRWSMVVNGATPAIESSMFYAGLSGPKASLQIVLKGAANGATDVTWRIERMSPAAVS
jgi:uncharacterized heparinase superfamily protein